MTQLTANQQRAAIAVRVQLPAFADGDTWGMVSDRELALIGANPAEPPAERVIAISQQRMNSWGHAAFQRGELLKLLAPHKDRGVVTNALKSLKSRNRIAQESSTECVVLSATYVRKRRGGLDVQCWDRKHAAGSLRDRRWLARIGWEKFPGQWDALLAEDGGQGATEKFARDIGAEGATSVIVQQGAQVIINGNNAQVAIINQAAPQGADAVCTACGQPAVLRQGSNPANGAWAAWYCLSGDKTHTRLVDLPAA